MSVSGADTALSSARIAAGSRWLQDWDPENERFWATTGRRIARKNLAFSIPVADYETVGNVVGGRHLKMLHAGLGIGRLIGDATYIHLLYEFTLAEKYDRTEETATHSQNRSDLAFTIGHKLLDYRLDIHLDANTYTWQAVDQEVDGEPVADTQPIKVTKKAK